eukprot:768793-Hanusia_phi.AAC.11
MQAVDVRCKSPSCHLSFSVGNPRKLEHAPICGTLFVCQPAGNLFPKCREHPAAKANSKTIPFSPSPSPMQYVRVRPIGLQP